MKPTRVARISLSLGVTIGLILSRQIPGSAQEAPNTETDSLPELAISHEQSADLQSAAGLQELEKLSRVWPEFEASAQAAAASRFLGPRSSQPLAISRGGSLLAVVNPDNNSVSFFDIRDDKNRRLATIQVGKEPNGVAFSPDTRYAYVANTVSGTVTAIRLTGGYNTPAIQHIKVGTEPYSLVMSPNGTKLYVANARSNNVSVINPATNKVVKTISGVGFEPRGLAMTNDGDGSDDDETVYVTNFLAAPVAGKLDGADDAKEGIVAVIPTWTDTVSAKVKLRPLADTGFKATGDALAKIPPGDPADPANFKFKTGAYTNQLNNIVVKGQYAVVPTTGASPNGPVRFDVNTQSLLSVINVLTNQDAGKTINMHKAVADQTNPAKTFITQPWAIAFEQGGWEGYVVSAASNLVVKVAMDAHTGRVWVLKDPTDSSRVKQIKVGKNPRGIVINHNDTRAYVMNYISRDVSVLALNGGPERVIATMKSADLPWPGTLAFKVHAGKELYNTSIGEFDPATPHGPPIVGRMSNKGWGSCSACHPNALSDNVVWIFPAGPRRTIPQHADFDLGQAARTHMRALNWSANRDEQPDFELNIRAVSGGLGLIVLDDGVTPDPNVNDFLPLANKGRKQLKIRGVGGWDALEAYIQFGVRSPISPYSKKDPDVISGEWLFKAANCQKCHGGASWTSSRVRYNPPPDPAQIVAGQLVEELTQVGTFDPAAKNEIRQNAAPPLGADGFVPPSILSIHAFPGPFLHNGAAATLGNVLNNVKHRSAGTHGSDTLLNPNDRIKVVKFLLSIDTGTKPIPITH